MYRALLTAALIVGLSLATASSALAELRGVVLVLKRGQDDTTRVTIHSDVKAEKKTDIPFDDALKVVEKMESWGSAVMVCIVADTNPKLGSSDGIPPPSEIAKLMKAVESNHWLSLSYLRIGAAQAGDDLAKHFIKSTSGK